jgi:hypothetical protein
MGRKADVVWASITTYKLNFRLPDVCYCQDMRGPHAPRGKIRGPMFGKFVIKVITTTLTADGNQGLPVVGGRKSRMNLSTHGKLGLIYAHGP